MLPQHRLLRRDTDRTAVQMADTQHFAADHRQGRRSKRVTFRTEKRRLDDIHTRFQSPVGLEVNILSQMVRLERVVRFRQPRLPRITGEFDGTERRRSRSAVAAGDDDLVGVGFRHTRRDGADTRRRNELDGDRRIGIDLLEIKDKLCKILDRIDVVMRWR